jgi:nitrile hydratase alpha subunit
MIATGIMGDLKLENGEAITGVDPAALDLIVATYETKIGPRNGARIVARAWSDPEYRARLFRDGTAAVAEVEKWSWNGACATPQQPRQSHRRLKDA